MIEESGFRRVEVIIPAENECRFKSDLLSLGGRILEIEASDPYPDLVSPSMLLEWSLAYGSKEPVLVITSDGWDSFKEEVLGKKVTGSIISAYSNLIRHSMWTHDVVGRNPYMENSPKYPECDCPLRSVEVISTIFRSRVDWLMTPLSLIALSKGWSSNPARGMDRFGIQSHEELKAVAGRLAEDLYDYEGPGLI